MVVGILALREGLLVAHLVDDALEALGDEREEVAAREDPHRIPLAQHREVADSAGPDQLSRRARLRILPTFVFGNSSRNSTSLGTL